MYGINIIYNSQCGVAMIREVVVAEAASQTISAACIHVEITISVS